MKPENLAKVHPWIAARLEQFAPDFKVEHILHLRIPLSPDEYNPRTKKFENPLGVFKPGQKSISPLRFRHVALIVLDTGDSEFYYGYLGASSCHWKDIYTRKAGFKLAVTRAFSRAYGLTRTLLLAKQSPVYKPMKPDCLIPRDSPNLVDEGLKFMNNTPYTLPFWKIEDIRRHGDPFNYKGSNETYYPI